MADASILTPAERAAMITRTEDQLLDEYVSILAAEVNKHYPTPYAVTMDADALARVFGEKYAYLVARRVKFTLSDDGCLWTRAVGPNLEFEVELDPADLFNRVANARSSIDHLGLLDEFHAGAVTDA